MKDVVRRGYDVLSHAYEQAYPTGTKYRPWLTGLLGGLTPGSRVVDLGSGCGLPVASSFADAGHRVTGVDFSEVQVRRARELVPGAEFVCADVSEVDFPAGSVDAVTSFYLLIHLPLAEQPPLLARIARWLRPGGWFLCTMGHGAWTGVDENWLGGGAAMWWSHADADTNRAWLTEAGFTVEHEEFVPEGDGGAVLFRARTDRDPAGSGGSGS
ncbi:class I SAM-dependent methyltransferase [Actinophytocola algeriensis]|uniref:SAM-dependent methyltransferase n=1 Tax=Actinophytocola algeriensis TaxID=1768010 RepID=A0A7W7PZV5_9PSEU|nr:class I SAM-dependent methyltransferase [Actinophytocola algeriensis]MBB4904386.1 SAM-dependent methyltransferase [Actinophytocola algeriensis]MBE1476756.1 SAM-dependent methyltransferase [Actinophytocola algeriensis]